MTDVDIARRVVARVLAKSRFYHGSSVRHKIGSTLQAKPHPTEFQRRGGDHARAEAFVEEHRPSSCPSRTKALYMVDNPGALNIAGAADDYVYRVEPIGSVTKADFAWVAEVTNALREGGDPTPYAKNYWAGKPYSGSEYRTLSFWEYLTSEFRILEEVK